MRWFAKACLAWAASAAGCGGAGPGPAAPTFEEARVRVAAALDAWRGGKVKGLATAAPPIRFVDPDQAAGAKLDSYRLGEGPKALGPVVDYPVEITITDRKRGTRTVQAVYQVVAEPDAAVLRNDDSP